MEDTVDVFGESRVSRAGWPTDGGSGPMRVAVVILVGGGALCVMFIVPREDRDESEERESIELRTGGSRSGTGSGDDGFEKPAKSGTVGTGS